MTTVIQTRQPLQVLSMSEQGRRKSKRIAAQYDEQDGDFKFARASKRAKTTTIATATATVEEANGEAAPRTRTTRTRRSAAVATTPTVVEEAPTTRRKSGRRRKASVEAEEAPAPAVVAPRRATRRSTRRTSSGEEEGLANGVEPAPAPAPAKRGRGAARQQDAATPRTAAVPTRADPDPAERAERVALPASDTPVMNRNKEMRKKGGGAGNRRSSLGSRGRRASSLIDMGHTALPHKEVGAAEFYKHVEEGLPEPRRMRQLLTWCGERALSDKPGLGSADSGAILGARAIQDQLLKDFQNKSEFSNWFDREESTAAAAPKQPNPRNVEHERKIEQLEERIKRLREQKKTWQSLKRIRLDPGPLFPDDASASHPPLPNEALLDAAEAETLRSLTGAESSFEALQARTASRLRAVGATLALRVDAFADSVHKLEQRVATAGREADRVLSLGAVRLREREERERAAAGTREVPLMEVIRSLGRILPEGDG